MRHWAESYVGLPYSDFNCAELCVKVCKEQFEKTINLPIDRSYNMHDESKKIIDLKDDFGISTVVPVEGDAVLMIGRGRLNHIGIVCYINGSLHILHAMRNVGITVLHNLLSLRHIGLKIEGYYKWK